MSARDQVIPEVMASAIAELLNEMLAADPDATSRLKDGQLLRFEVWPA